MMRLMILLGMFSLAACGSVKKITEELPKAEPETALVNTIDTLAQPPVDEKEYSPESIAILIEAGKEKALGNDKRAVAFYMQALEIDETNDAAHYELAKFYDESDLTDKALVHAKRAAEIDPSNKWYLELLGNMLVANNNYDEGIEVFEKLSEQYPKDIDYLYDLAYAYQQGSRNQEAVEVFERLESLLGASDPSVIFRKHRLLAAEGKVNEAADEIKKLIKSNPQEIRYIGYLAEFYELNGKLEEALIQYDQLLKVEPTNPQALAAKVDLYRLTENIPEFEKALQTLITSSAFTLDDKVKVLYPMVENMGEGNPFEKSYTAAAKQMTLEYPDNAKAFALYGDFLYNAGKLDDAVEAYNQAIKLRQDVFSIWEQLMFIHSTRRDYENLDVVSKEAMTHFPDEALSFYMNGLSNYQLKNIDLAISSLTKGVTLNATDRMLSEMYSLLGDSYHAVKKYGDSDLSYDNALLKDPDNVYVLNNYSYYLSLRGENLGKAEKMIARAVELSPGDANLLDTYAWVMFKKGEFESALPFMEKALDLDGKNPTLIEHYGDILFKLGRKADAVKKWQKAITLGKVNDVLKRKIQDKQYYEY